MKILRRTPHGRRAPAPPSRRLPGAPSLRTRQRKVCRTAVATRARRRSL